MEQIKDNLWKLNDTQQLRKGKKYYSIIYPIRENGKIIWKNLFRIDFFTALMIVIIIIMSYSYYSDTKECRTIVSQYNNNPMKFCSEHIIRYGYVGEKMPEINLTGIGDGDGELNLSLYP